MEMKRLMIFAPLLFAGCLPIGEQTCGPTDAIVIGESKTGALIYDDLPLLPPCDVSWPDTRKDTPTPVSEPPVTTTPPLEPPVDGPDKVKGNNGWGNGDQDAPGNSEFNNRAENRGGNHNGRNEAPANSWHGE